MDIHKDELTDETGWFPFVQRRMRGYDNRYENAKDYLQ